MVKDKKGVVGWWLGIASCWVDKRMPDLVILRVNFIFLLFLRIMFGHTKSTIVGTELRCCSQVLV